MKGTRYSDIALCRRVLGVARPYWPHLLALSVLSLLWPFIALLYPIPVKIAVDSVIGSHPLPGFLDGLLPSVATSSKTALLLSAAALLVAIALLAQAQHAVLSLLQAYTGEQLVLAFRGRIFRHAQRLSLSYHDTKGAADSLYRIQYDAPSIRHIAIEGLIPIVTAAFMLGAMVYVIVLLDVQLALVALAISPLLFVVSGFYRRRLRSHSNAVREVESSALSAAHEALGALRVVKAFGREDYEQQRFARRHGEGLRARLRLAFLERELGSFVTLIVALGQAAVLFLGIRHVQAGVLTLGELLMVMAYLGRLYEPLKTLSRKAVDLQGSLVGAQRAFSVLDGAPEVVERPDARRLARAAGGVVFRDVSFRYSDGQVALKGLSFETGPGARLGVMGATGAGKSTLASLLIRFYDPTSGAIFLDGVNLRDYRLADLRDQFAVVLQESVLFSASIAENIAYARPSASRRDIVRAAEAANAHTFILSLPDAYETQVGERGMRLSGGERQRIALARAFLKDAPVLILDEPTSAVDAATEAEIFEAMERLMPGRTTILISHRVSALRKCHALLVLEDGQGVGFGPPSEILAAVAGARSG